LLHAIGRMEPPGGTNTWLRKYIFPGGYTPALSEVLRAIEKAGGLWVTDIEVLRLHYAETLRQWRERFLANRERIKQTAGYDERFCRMWDFYLAGCEVAFRHLNQMVFQIQITRRQDAVPLTRDYMIDAERGAAVPQSMAAE
jgi:cyclopropane-fatty-acyl-phospholipid synthase